MWRACALIIFPFHAVYFNVTFLSPFSSLPPKRAGRHLTVLNVSNRHFAYTRSILSFHLVHLIIVSAEAVQIILRYETIIV